MNSRLDLRDLLQLWTDDISSFEHAGRLGRNLADALAVLARSVLRVAIAARPFPSVPGSVVHGEDPFKPKTPVGGVPKVQKIKKSVVVAFCKAENENKVKTDSVKNEPIHFKDMKTEGVKNEPIQPPLPLVWAM